MIFILNETGKGNSKYQYLNFKITNIGKRTKINGKQSK
jgi:hypothetical protein